MLRNSRGETTPSVVEAARAAIDAGAHGITLHPRADRRHALLDDIDAVMQLKAVRLRKVELNVEGDYRSDLLQRAKDSGAHQFTLVPVQPGERTSTRGWREPDGAEPVRNVVEFFSGQARVSLFVDAEPACVRFAHGCGVHAVEFYTGHYAAQFGNKNGETQLSALARAAEEARKLGLRVHAGHDLNLSNLGPLIRKIAPDEVSIGHALIADALYMGLSIAVASYLRAVRAT